MVKIYFSLFYFNFDGMNYINVKQFEKLRNTLFFISFFNKKNVSTMNHGLNILIHYFCHRCLDEKHFEIPTLILYNFFSG